MACDDIPKAALITGGARRIGAVIVRDLARHGWAVAVHHLRSGRDAEALVGEIGAAGGKAVALPADLTVEDEVSSLIERAAAELGPVGCLVNNASVFELDTIEDMTRTSWDRHLAVNLRAPVVLTQAFAAHLPPDRSGCVINILDQRVWNLTPYFLSYTVSKSALWTLTRTTALALAPRIRVNAIGPGPTMPSARQSSAQFDRQWVETPLRRGTSSGEIAAAVRYILDAPAMTGQMIALDGGQHLGWAQAGSAGYSEE